MPEIIDSKGFEEKVIKGEGPIMVDFFATWCGPCKMLAPVLEELAEELEGKATIYKVDVDESPEVAAQYNVMSVPTVMVFEHGEVKNHALGAQPKASLLALLD